MLSRQRTDTQASFRSGVLTQLSEHPVELSSQLGYPDIVKPEHVLVTGATGYLGSHVLQQLIVKSSARIYALVRRASDGTTAMQRLTKVMQDYFGKQLADQLAERVEIVEGNLEEKTLGCLVNSKLTFNHALTASFTVQLTYDISEKHHSLPKRMSKVPLPC